MDKSEIERNIILILNTVLKESFEPGQDISRDNVPKWDSLKHIEIVFLLEDKFGLQYGEEELGEMRSVDDILNKTMEKYAS